METKDPLLPTAAEITAGIEKVKLEEEEQEVWLEGPEAARQREDSQTAYTDLNAAAAREALSSTFTEQLEQLDAEPARVLSQARLLSSSDETSATIKLDGKGVVMDSLMPVRTENQSGEARKVDVGLEKTGNGYETENGLVEVRIPEAVDEAVHIGNEGVSIKLLGADGGRTAKPYDETDVFASDVLPDTDMLVSPIATGVEISNVLRSENSPETLHYQVTMPPGAVLQQASEGGFEVVEGDEILATIPRPTAVDAQGTDVRVDARVKGSILALTVAHGTDEYAMPILVDPIVENGEGWFAWANLDVTANWGFSKNVAGMYGSTTCIYECFPWSGHGLYVSGQSGYYWPNQYAKWAYSAPNTNSYVLNPSLAPYVRHDHGCPASQYPEPYDFFGVWGLPGQWNYLSINSSNQPYNAYYLPYAGYSVVFGLSTGGSEFAMPCWRDLYAGGALVYLDDWGSPSIAQVQSPTAEWIQPTTPVHIVAQASDAGLGVQNVLVKPENQPVIRAIDFQSQCTGTRKSPCLTGFTGTFDVHGASFGEGRRPSGVVAYDATGKYSNEYWFETKVDGTLPQISLSGQLATATHETGSRQAGEENAEKLKLPIYNLTVGAEDGKPGRPEREWQSGVRSIQISLDGVPLKTEEANTCGHDCPLSLSYPVPLTGIQTAGVHVLEVVVTDFSGNATHRPIEFEYFPATGMKDEYVMQYFPLPDGRGNEMAEEHPERPELAVNVMNGNLVYRETDVDVESHAGLDLEVERYYNSMLPNSANTEWGDGWTLAQTPELEPIKTGSSQVPNEAEIVDQSGLVEGGVSLPTQEGTSKFDPSLHATVTKAANGGYVLSDETGELPGMLAFDSAGQAQALHDDDGDAKVEFGYQGGDLVSVEVNDPGTFAAEPTELEIPDRQLVTQPTYARAFGSSGTANGQMKSPGDVVIDAQGNVWVVDQSNNRVEKFDPAGNFLAKFGSSGTGDGQFSRPTAIAFAMNGDLLVTDAGNSRVERFNSVGTYVSSFGTKGTGNGQFASRGPEGIAVDSEENVWVSDTYGGRLEKFNSAGVFQLSIATKGSGTGQLGEPTGLDIAPNGDVWVADWENNHVSVFNSAGAFQGSFGSVGTGDGQFRNPDELEIDKLGNVWIGDAGNTRVQQFDLAGQFKAKFGSAGTGQGQFSFAYPMGIAADSKGHLWVTDANNNRVQQWIVPIERPTYMSAFGSEGSANGTLRAPGDVAVGVEGSILVVDTANNRIQKFDSTGDFISSFGTLGTGDGQFNRPTAIAVDRDGDILVADSGNNRIEKFSPDGQFISKFGTSGTGISQFSTPEGVAADFAGNIWVADSGNGRLEKFDEEGNFTTVVGSKGTGIGQLGTPIGIDVDSAGNAWVADLSNNRVAVFEPGGSFLRQFGTLGTANGQFNQPSGIEVDSRNNVWVTDLGNQRVQRFNLEGNYVGQFGSAGSGEGQFAFPTANGPAGLTVDGYGAIWVVDTNHAKVQRWQIGNFQIPPSKPLDLMDGDPRVEVQTSAGLVSKVAGNAAGTNTYVHSGDDLTARVGPDGRVEYTYDSGGRMTEVRLPNGTWGSLAYQPDGRVERVTVHVAGATSSKTTEFSYQDTPTRRTVVFFSDAPHVTYDIGEDGSVLKWWNKIQPPVIDLSGNLADLSNRETAAPVSAGLYFLTAKADDAEGIYSIDVIANGALVDEWTCPQKKELACMEPVNQWVMETSEFAPGILNLEVLVTDQADETAAERFWVNIPQSPPPSIGAPEEPTFGQIKQFREEYGLEVVFPAANEIEFDERIAGLIDAWHSPGSPMGEVARTSWERWGVPLRPEDIAELNYREAYVAQDGPLIREWAEANHPNAYAGYWVDHRAGGLIRVGFKASGAAELEQLLAEVKTIPGLAATPRIASFTGTAVHSFSELSSLQYTIGATSSEDPVLAGKISSVGIDIPSNSTTIGTSDVQGVTNRLHELYGSSAPLSIRFEALGQPLSRRYVNEGPVYGGQKIGVVQGKDSEGHLLIRSCTAGFAAWSRPAQSTPNQQKPLTYFQLTAGHCFEPGDEVVRMLVTDHHFERPIGVGEATSRKWQILHSLDEFEDDGEAIRLNSPRLATAHVLGRHDSLPTVKGVASPEVGQTLCTSLGESNAVKCRPLTEPAVINPGYEGQWTGPFWQLPTGVIGENGDSGSPVWIQGSNQAVGLDAFGPVTKATPLLPPPLPEEGRYPWLKPAREQAMGLMNEPFMEGLHIVTDN